MHCLESIRPRSLSVVSPCDSQMTILLRVPRLDWAQPVVGGPGHVKPAGTGLSPRRPEQRQLAEEGRSPGQVHGAPPVGQLDGRPRVHLKADAVAEVHHLGAEGGLQDGE